MKLGFITAILDSWTYEEMMDFASEQGFECVEVACWPQEKAERRYAGVSHIDAERVNQDDEYAAHIMAYAEKAGVEISALAYYPNVMTADKEKRNAAIEHLKNVIRASKKLGVGMVTTFIGRDQTKNQLSRIAVTNPSFIGMPSCFFLSLYICIISPMELV